MFSIVRKLIVLAVVAGGSVVVWEVVDIPAQLGFVEPGANAEDELDSPTAPADAGSLQDASTGKRLLAWAVFVLLLPVLTAPLAGRVIGGESNTANVLLLFGYTGLGVLAARTVDGIHVAGIWSAVAYLIGLLAMFAYNLWICAFVAKLRGV